MEVPASVVTTTPYGRHNRRGLVSVQREADDLASIVVRAGEQTVSITVADSHLAGIIDLLLACQASPAVRLRAVNE